jgi:hypothetical protein
MLQIYVVLFHFPNKECVYFTLSIIFNYLFSRTCWYIVSCSLFEMSFVISESSLVIITKQVT